MIIHKSLLKRLTISESGVLHEEIAQNFDKNEAGYNVKVNMEWYRSNINDFCAVELEHVEVYDLGTNSNSLYAIQQTQQPILLK